MSPFSLCGRGGDLLSPSLAEIKAVAKQNGRREREKYSAWKAQKVLILLLNCE